MKALVTCLGAALVLFAGCGQWSLRPPPRPGTRAVAPAELAACDGLDTKQTAWQAVALGAGLFTGAASGTEAASLPDDARYGVALAGVALGGFGAIAGALGKLYARRYTMRCAGAP